MNDEVCQNNILKIGMVNFINTSPILIPWKQAKMPSMFELIEDIPTVLNTMLKNGQIDIGLVSSFAYAQLVEELILLPDIGISATGAVQSVLLLSKEPFEQLNNKLVILTKQSATSVNLLKIVLEEFFHVYPTYKIGTFKEVDTDPNKSAYLAIGDEALFLARNLKGYHILDLAQIWLDKTGLPFVFAVMALRRDIVSNKSSLISSFWYFLKKMVARGQMSLDSISEKVCGRIPMSKLDTVRYLRDIEFDLSFKKQEGLCLFFNYLAQKDIIAPVKTIEFFDI